MAEVKLLGFWSSPFVHRVKWALKLKGINYEYIEQDRFNKSELLLQSNPVYKKVPVLVHGGNAIADSPVILAYIEETWPDIPLLPQDAYDRAIARFWMKYAEEIIPSVTAPFFRNFKDEQEKEDTTKRALENLLVLEKQALGEDKKFFGGNNIGLVDISCGSLAIWVEALEELVGIKLIEPNNLPQLNAWLQRFKQIPVIKENLPDYQKLLIHLQWRREGIISGTLKQ